VNRERDSRTPTILLGSTGLLGRALVRRLESAGLAFVAAPREKLDLSRLDRVGPELESLRPGAVINAAAFADVSKAEMPEYRDEVFRMNRDVPGVLARVCANLGVPLVHVSTDYVFDGTLRRPYREDDDTNPLQVYGRSKLEGEWAVQDAYPGALVVRTSTLFGHGRPHRPGYVEAILRQAEVKSRLDVVETPISSPTYSRDLAGGILRLLEIRAAGVVHLVNAGACSRLELARAAVRIAGHDACEVRPREEPPGDLARPAYSVLDTARYQSLTGDRLRDWRDSVAAYVAERNA
jgi:dTDP-4-dehydrorhamnose reductase